MTLLCLNMLHAYTHSLPRLPLRLRNTVRPAKHSARTSRAAHSGLSGETVFEHPFRDDAVDFGMDLGVTPGYAHVVFFAAGLRFAEGVGGGEAVPPFAAGWG